MGYLDLSKQELEKEYDNLVKRFEEIKGMGLNLNMARGKPGKEQLDLSLPMLDTINSKSDFIGEDKMDCRNYGLLNGITECRKLFADILGVDAENVIVGGSSSLNMMFDTISCFMTAPAVEGCKPWYEVKNRKFLCPVPGYDRHFGITQYYGFELIPIQMDDNGPDMDMVERLVYQDISRRTDGDVYIGVVGPVRTGKSTFIKRFMDSLVLPNIRDEAVYRRTVDELPQSAAGRTIMTTEPKFIPEESVEINLGGNTTLNVRMIDCVGYIVNSAIGYSEEDEPRMVKTPWSNEAIPFDDAAEIGTKKVITDHSTIGLVITTDGTISDIPREDYIESEKRVINELKAINKPFIILLNSVDPTADETIQLSNEMTAEYKVPVIPVSCMELDETEIKRILAQLLFEFPIREIKVDIPKWVVKLDKDHWLKSVVFDSIKKNAAKIEKIRQIQQIISDIEQCEYITSAKVTSLDLGKGYAEMTVSIKSELFYKVISEETGLDITEEYELLNCIKTLSQKQKEFDKIAQAYEQVQETGYGIVMPTIDELTLDEPQIIKQSGKYGIKLRASAPSIHMMKIFTQTEVTPIVGSEQQSEELVSYLLREFDENPEKIWESNIFGKSVHELVNEGLHNKLYRMPADARRRIGETVEKIINDGCNGLICIIL